MVLNESVKNKLDHINWDFGERLVVDDNAIFPFNNRKYHSYPATYIPEIPFSLIEILSKEGDVVLDPFGGIGTTFVQALIQRRIPISVDNNSVASRITEDFFVLFNPLNDLNVALDLVLRAVNTYNENCEYRFNECGLSRELEAWYEPKTRNQVAFLTEEYNKMKHSRSEEGSLELFHLCLSSILTTVCGQNGGWAYIADNVKPKAEKLIEKRVIDRFVSNTTLCVRNIQNYKNILGESTLAIYNDKRFDNVFCADYSSMNVSALREKVDLVVTSPPYPRMIDYVKSQRLTYYMEERDFKDELATEIGARARRNLPNTIDSYVSSMKKCNERIVSSLKRGGYLCYILPDFSQEKNTDRRMAVDQVLDDCKERGMQVVYKTNRCIPGTQRSNNIKWASLKQEQIIILEKIWQV